MNIVPSVDVRGGRVVFRGGVAADVPPRELAARFVAEGADELHLVDLDAAEHGVAANFELLAGIARETSVPVRLAGGISSLARADQAIGAGFDGVLFSSAVFGDDGMLAGIAALGERAIVEVEARDGGLAPRGGAPELVRLARGRDAIGAATAAASAGVRGIYAIDVSADGRLTGPPAVLLEQLRRALPATVALHTGGGVRDLDDVRTLARAGVASVVVGRAIAEGRFTIAQAKAACA